MPQSKLLTINTNILSGAQNPIRNHVPHTVKQCDAYKIATDIRRQNNAIVNLALKLQDELESVNKEYAKAISEFKNVKARSLKHRQCQVFGNTNKNVQNLFSSLNVNSETRIALKEKANKDSSNKNKDEFDNEFTPSSDEKYHLVVDENKTKNRNSKQFILKSVLRRENLQLDQLGQSPKNIININDKQNIIGLNSTEFNQCESPKSILFKCSRYRDSSISSFKHFQLSPSGSNKKVGFTNQVSMLKFNIDQSANALASLKIAKVGMRYA